ncbi:MAG TPA: hypothetical protein VFF81_11895 [Noviherbaspirillum sp.]|nr:hypothetical protein [Noviherbaspirillum sp.]
MNELHRDLLGALEQLSARRDEALDRNFPAFVSFVRRIFRQEESGWGIKIFPHIVLI